MGMMRHFFFYCNVRLLDHSIGRKERRTGLSEAHLDGWMGGWRAGKLYDMGIKKRGTGKVGEVRQVEEKTNLVQSVHDCRRKVCPHETLLRLLFCVFDCGRFATVVLLTAISDASMYIGDTNTMIFVMSHV